MTVEGVTGERMRRVAKLVRSNPYIPVIPTHRQLEFLAAPHREKGYGGAAGGGKSIAVLMETLLPINQKGYNGLILRRTFPDLSQPDAIMDVAKSWLRQTDAKWNERDKMFFFPKFGSKLQFGFMEREEHKYRYQSAQFQKIAFDEATQFPWSQYSYVRSRARRSVSVMVPPTIVAATNPGNIGHQWFYSWFVKGISEERVFVPALIDDNKYLRKAEYKKMLKDMSDVEKKQLLEGAWIVDDSGHPFKSTFWDRKNRYLAGLSRIDVEARWIFVDTSVKDKSTSAFNVAIVMELLKDWRIRIRYVWREKCQFPALVSKLNGLAETFNYDGRLRGVVIEDKASGPTVYQTVMSGADSVLRRTIRTFWMSGGKQEKHHQASLWCERDCVELPHPTVQSNIADWLFPFEEEIYGVPDTEYKDQADTFAMGLMFLEHLIARGLRARLAVRKAEAS